MTGIELTHHFDFIVGLFAMMDPLAAIPVLLGITAGFTAAQRRKTVLSAFLAMSCILLLTQYSGVWLLETLGTSLASLQIAGGVVIAWSGFRMLTEAGGAEVPVGSGSASVSPYQLGIVPLAVPLIAGPGAITKVLLEAQDTVGVDNPVHITINILIVCVACGIVLLLAVSSAVSSAPRASSSSTASSACWSSRSASRSRLQASPPTSPTSSAEDGLRAGAQGHDLRGWRDGSESGQDVSDGAYNEGLRAYLEDDFEGALGFWRPLAEAGDGKAAYRVGYMHETGQGMAVDPTKAAEWYDKAAMAGDCEAMAALGSLFLHGIGVPQDYSRAYVLLSLAVAHGARNAAGLRDRAAGFLSRDQLAALELEAGRRFGHRND